MTLLKLFGSPELKYESKSQLLPLNTPSSLLFYLAVKGSWVSRSELAFLYRPDETEKEALRYLRLQLHRAQQYDWAGSLEVEQQQLRWLIATDIHSFQTAIKAQSWSEAISLYQDSFFAKHSLNFPTYNTWLELEHEQLEQAIYNK